MRMVMAFVLVSTLAACARVPGAAAIRSTIQQMAAAAEAKRTGEVLEHVAADFTGNDGEFDRAALERMLRARVLAAQAIGVSIGPVAVEVDGHRATARFTMTVTDESGRWLSDRRAVLDMVTGWRNEAGVWRCNNARWESK